MHWWGNASTGQVKRAAASPGTGWAQFPASTDNYSLAQIQAYVKSHTETPPVDNSVLGQIGSGSKQAAEQAAGTTGWTHNVEQWIIRGFEMLLGIGLIIVALAKLAADTPAGRAAAKAGKVAAIL